SLRKLFYNMHRIFFPLLLLLVIIGIDNVAVANIKVQVNTVVVPVADRTPAARQVAINQAFDNVLIKMSGNPEAPNLSTLKDARTQANQWVQSYTYLTTSSDQNTLTLQISFNQSAIIDLLKQADQPL